MRFIRPNTKCKIKTNEAIQISHVQQGYWSSIPNPHGTRASNTAIMNSAFLCLLANLSTALLNFRLSCAFPDMAQVWYALCLKDIIRGKSKLAGRTGVQHLGDSLVSQEHR